MKFTVKQINALKTEKPRDAVTEEGGLQLRYSKTGKKSFYYVYKYQGKPKRVKLGDYPELSLSEARIKLAEAKKERSQGVDPATARQEEKVEFKKAPTFEEFAKEYVTRWAKPNKKTWTEDQRILDRYVIPFIGSMKMADITRRDIITVLDKLQQRGIQTQANRTYEVIRRLFNFSVERGVLEMHPATHIKMKSLPPRDRVLTRDELRAVIQALNGRSLWIGTRFALEVILRTAQRPGEVRQMEVQELQLDKRLWTIPSEKTKNGDAPQTVPLPSQVADIIKTAQAFSSGSWIFRAPRKEGCPVSREAVSNAMKDTVAGLDMPRATAHDLRRTAATYISELGFNRMVVDKILNHKDGSTTGIYDRYNYLKEKREALEAWNHELDLILAGKDQPKVVDIGSAVG